jgi:hypothetical protein
MASKKKRWKLRALVSPAALGIGLVYLQALKPTDAKKLNLALLRRSERSDKKQDQNQKFQNDEKLHLETAFDKQDAVLK